MTEFILHCEAKKICTILFFFNNFVKSYFIRIITGTHNRNKLEQNNIKIINLLWRMSLYCLVKCSIHTHHHHHHRIFYSGLTLVLSRKLECHHYCLTSQVCTIQWCIQYFNLAEGGGVNCKNFPMIFLLFTIQQCVLSYTPVGTFQTSQNVAGIF